MREQTRVRDDAFAAALHAGGLEERLLADDTLAAAAARIAGEGLTTAAVLAGLAGPRTLVSNAFRQALAEQAPRLAEDLQPVKDLAGPGGAALFRDDAAGARARGQRRTLLAAGGIAALLVAGGVAREARLRYEAAHQPAVILLDIRMPVMTGTDALRELRSDPTFSAVPIIALTAHALEEERRSLLAAGFDDLISKPCLPDQLATVVEQLLTNERKTAATDDAA